MKPLKLSEIARAVGGQLNNSAMGDAFVRGVSFDTREDVKGKLFVPLQGINADGHKYMEQALQKGAVCTFSQQETDICAIYVDDTKQALMDLAEYYRSLFNVTIVGITGSNGKTSCKDMVASVLSQKFNVVKTLGNFNNEIGLPSSIFNIDEDTEVAVLEMGMNNRWEIHRLSKIARPNVAIITNIGVAHIENLGSREEIFKAKSEITDFLAPDGRVFACGDDDFLPQLDTRGDVTYYGFGTLNTYQPTNHADKGLDGSSYTVALQNEDFVDINLPSPGRHMVLNSLAAVAAGDYMGLSANQIAQGIAGYQSSGMRMDVRDLKGGGKLIVDCYNANPDSMKAALQVLSTAKGRKVAILGDMYELGEETDKMHYGCGEYAAKLGIDVIYCIGEHAQHIFEGADKGGAWSIAHFINKDSFLQSFGGVQAGDTVLLKASRGMKLEEIADKLERE
ncbi:MAG: UDP-N-acetylmuramoyl-tripeptide--D-alanyl-D-alanine ligase [Defluviitaleaceae bacterium]|nr:UDP-N-acetylmuramoyl-tripeptide--D-alanyl-D-alanine ligase [Defluviitaleaceae bacterium]